MTYSEKYQDRYIKFWAPCMHDVEDKKRLNREYLMAGVSVDDLLWEVNIGLLGRPTLDADQWVGVSTKVYDGDKPWMFYCEADDFNLALTETIIQISIHKNGGLWEPQIYHIGLALEGHNPPKWATWDHDTDYGKVYRVSEYAKDPE